MNTNYILGAVIALFCMAYLWPFQPKPKRKNKTETSDNDDDNQIFINP